MQGFSSQAASDPSPGLHGQPINTAMRTGTSSATPAAPPPTALRVTSASSLPPTATCAAAVNIVPTPNVSVVDMVLEISCDTTKGEVNQVLKAAIVAKNWT